MVMYKVGSFDLLQCRFVARFLVYNEFQLHCDKRSLFYLGKGEIRSLEKKLVASTCQYFVVQCPLHTWMNVMSFGLQKLNSAPTYSMMTSAACVAPNLCGVEHGMMEHQDKWTLQKFQNLIFSGTCVIIWNIKWNTKMGTMNSQLVAHPVSEGEG